jgi:hypothetical protein
MGLGPNARRWVSLLMAGKRATVTFGDARSRFFTMHSGVAQGSPLSPLLYVIAAQPLAAALRRLQAQGSEKKGSSTPSSSPGVPPPRLVTNTPTTSQSTPPPWSQQGSPSSGPCNPFVRPLAPCSTSTSARASPSAHTRLSSDITWLRASRSSTPRLRYDIWGCFSPRKVLLTKGDARTTADEAWQKVVNAVRIPVSHWRSVTLTILGRAYVAKQLMASVITHLATFVDPFFTLSLYTLGKARPMRAKREVKVIVRVRVG